MHLFSGGHTYEITQLVGGLSKSFTPRIYVLAETDKRSEHKVLELEEKLKNKHDTPGKVSFILLHSLYCKAGITNMFG